jgi:hypothetical protein
MDHARFDQLTRNLGALRSRRGLLAGGLAALSALVAPVTQAKQHKHKHKHKHNKPACRRTGLSCTSSGQCCSGKCGAVNGVGTCRAAACVAAGESCANTSQCCTVPCGASGLAVQPFFCRQADCRAAGGACAAGGECCEGLCQNGICICPDGLLNCGGRCVDTRTDSANCGGCGADNPAFVCTAPATCVGGICAVG